MKPLLEMAPVMVNWLLLFSQVCGAVSVVGMPQVLFPVLVRPDWRERGLPLQAKPPVVNWTQAALEMASFTLAWRLACPSTRRTPG